DHTIWIRVAVKQKGNVIGQAGLAPAQVLDVGKAGRCGYHRGYRPIDDGSCSWIDHLFDQQTVITASSTPLVGDARAIGAPGGVGDDVMNGVSRGYNQRRCAAGGRYQIDATLSLCLSRRGRIVARKS